MDQLASAEQVGATAPRGPPSSHITLQRPSGCGVLDRLMVCASPNCNMSLFTAKNI